MRHDPADGTPGGQPAAGSVGKQYDSTRIIDPFVTTKVAGLGTGLGLGICHAIVADHGGTLTYRRDRGFTIFAVNLPPVPAE